MNQVNILDQILKDTFTQSQLKRRVLALKRYLIEKFYKESAPGVVSEYSAEETTWLSTLTPDFLSQFSAGNVYQIFKSLETEVNSLPVLTLYTAIEIPATELSLLGSYVRTNFKKNIMLQMKINPSLIAGCAMVWNGIYHDYSTKSKIDSNKQIIIHSFKNFMQNKKIT